MHGTVSLPIKLAARYLWGRKLRTTLTTLAVVFGVLVIFATNNMMPSMLAALQRNLLAASGQADVTVRHRLDEAFKLSVVRQVRAVPGVRAAAGSLQRNINIPDGFYGHDAEVAAVTLIGIDPHDAQAVRGYQVVDGRFLNADDTYAAVLAGSLADTLGLKVGDDLRLPTAEGAVKLTVVGLLPARTLPGNEEVLVSLTQAQKLLAMPDRINTVEASLASTNPQERAAIQQAIEAALGPDYTIGALASAGQLYASLQMGQVMFGVLGFLVLLMGGFIILNTFRTIIAERQRDIGMLRAIGASRRTILALMLAEGLVQGVAGTALGMALGYLASAAIVSAMSPMLQQFIHLQMGGGPVVSLGLVVGTAALGVGVTLLSGLLPALAATRVTPLDALRPAVVESGQRAMGKGPVAGMVLLGLAAVSIVSGSSGLAAVGALLLLVGLVLVAPLLVRPTAAAFGRVLALLFAREGTATLAEGNVARQPGRAAITASTTMVGLALLIAAGATMASLMGFMQTAVEKSLGSDYLLVPPSVGLWGTNVGADQGLAGRLRAVPGVAAVSTMRYAQTEIGGQPASVLGIDPVAFPQVAALDISKGNPATVYQELASGRGLIVNWILAGQAGLKPGDVLHLPTPTGLKDYRVVAVAGDFYNAKMATVYISQSNLRTDFRRTEDVFIQIKRAPGANPEVLEPRLKAVAAQYPQFKLVSGQEMRDQLQPQLQAMASVLYVVLAVLAVPSLIALLNTLAIGVIERLREIGMLRAIGATRKHVRRVVIAEALLLAGLGTGIGLVAGVYLAYVTIQATAVAGFPISFSFPVGGIIAAVVIGLTFGLLAALVPARQAARVQIVEALRYE